jgi:hypothetical protein
MSRKVDIEAIWVCITVLFVCVFETGFLLAGLELLA